MGKSKDGLVDTMKGPAAKMQDPWAECGHVKPGRRTVGGRPRGVASDKRGNALTCELAPAGDSSDEIFRGERWTTCNNLSGLQEKEPQLRLR
jgi:hypothetical protein